MLDPKVHNINIRFLLKLYNRNKSKVLKRTKSNLNLFLTSNLIFYLLHRRSVVLYQIVISKVNTQSGCEDLGIRKIEFGQYGWYNNVV